MGTLTVRENLTFSAALRLPASYNWEERKEKVEDVIKELRLEKVADSRVKESLLISLLCCLFTRLVPSV